MSTASASSTASATPSVARVNIRYDDRLTQMFMTASVGWGLVGLLVGPMFIVAEAMFSLGWNRPLLDEIERRVGPTVLRDLAKIA